MKKAILLLAFVFAFATQSFTNNETIESIDTEISIEAEVSSLGILCNQPGGTGTVEITHGGASRGGTEYWICCDGDCESVDMVEALNQCAIWND